MTKVARLILAVLLVPLFIPLVNAASSILGNTVNVGQMGGTNVTTGAGASTPGTQRVILSSDSPIGALSAGSAQIGTVSGSSFTLQGSGGAMIGSTGNRLNVDIQGSTSAVTGLNGAALATAAAQTTGNSSLSSIDGKITAVNTGAVTISVALPTGTNNIGTVTGSSVNIQAQGTAITQTGGRLNVDVQTSTIVVVGTGQTALASAANQTTGNSSLSSIDGKITAVNTGAVVISGALPAGSALIGKTGIDQTTPGTTNKVSIGTDGTVAINTALPAGSAIIGKVSPDSTISIVKSSVTTVAASTQLFASNASRKGVECAALCSNTANAYGNWGASAAVVTDTIVFAPCSSWQPPPGIINTAAMQVIGDSVGQTVRCTEY